MEVNDLSWMSFSHKKMITSAEDKIIKLKIEVSYNSII